MFDYDKWQEILSTIQKHKLRTGLTCLGVFWGIFMLVFLMGAGNGLQNGVNGIFGGHAKNSVYMGTNKTTVPYKGRKPGRWFSLTNDDIEAIRINFADKVAYVAPRLWMPSGETWYKDKKGSFDVRGDMPDLLHIDALEMVSGRFINDLDVADKRKVAVIGREVASTLFGDASPLGKYIEFSSREFLVAGVIKSNRSGQEAMDDDKTIFIPLTTAQQLRNRPNHVGWFVCSMQPGVEVRPVEEGIKTFLKQRHSVAPEDRRAIWSDNIEEEFKEINGLFTGISVIVWFVGIGSLLAGIIGVGNIMLILVKERTKEIGIRKALGATPSSIVSMILMESIFLTTIAGYMGLGSSVAVLYLVSLAIGPGAGFFGTPEVNLGVCLLALAILVICGALTGLIPAIQAASVNPVVALKDE